MNIPANLKYSEEHEWLKIEGNLAIVGITDYAQSQLGDIVFVDIQTEGETLERNEVFGAVEAVKTVADLFMPVSGTIEKWNESLEAEPQKVNEDPYGAGWMVKIRMSDPHEAEELLNAEAYGKLIS